MRKQIGQSSLLMLVFSLVLMLTVIFIFNSAQLLSERQKAKMLADHAAHATATRQARLLNMNAYINRTQIANQLAIAQAVSTSSWAKYAARTSENISKATFWFPPVGAMFSGIGSGMDAFAEAMGLYLQTYSMQVKTIELAQNALNTSSNALILTAPEEFAALAVNAREDPYNIGLLASGSQFPAQIMKQYQGRERQRMADVVMSSTDDFITNRSKDNILPSINLALIKVKIHKRGGTELIDLNEWKGVDTLSMHISERYFKKLKWRTRKTEVPLGWGSAAGSLTGNDSARNRGNYGGASSVNPKARWAAENSRPQWDVRSYGGSMSGVGIPEYYDLKDLTDKQTIFPLTVMVKKDKSNLRVSTRQSNLKPSDRFTVLDNYNDLDRGTISNGNMLAITKAEVFFQRPWGQEVVGNQINHENGSLYSPYWQVRLSDDIAANKRALILAEALVR